MRTPLPPNLPDQRTAERLLNIIDQLEASLQHAPERQEHAPPATDEILALQTENATLKARQLAAAKKLRTLLGRLAAAEPESTSA